MKRITAILLCILLCTSIAGCIDNLASVDSSLSLVSEFEQDRQTETTDSSVPDTSEIDDSKVSETTGDHTETTEPDTSAGTQTGTPTIPDIIPSGGNTGTGSNRTDASKDADTSKESKPTQATTPPKTDAATESTPNEESKPSEPEKPKDTTHSTEKNRPEETEPTAEETKPQESADPYAYPFNIEQIRRDCIALGRSYGFALDESLTPSNSSWAGAETASSDTQGTRLKILLTEMVEYYSPVYRENMGLPAVNITAFNIYCESTGNGTYRIYFLFLL